ncbi:MAG TPA: hypothetical protein VFH88_15515 [Candidatus Krumholzibacteria bacterium]|nr:hypothetical protein [Candidatus Krumholzibacteria bacterium]
MGVRRFFACTLAVVVYAAAASAQEPGPEPRYFYHSYSYGSDATFNPASEIINGAFGIMQISTNWEPLEQVDFQQGLHITWESITHPASTIRAYGTEDFIADQMFPTHFAWHDLQWVPNYSLHLIGGGARHRAFTEWYGAHNFPAPWAWAWGTTIAHAFAVETIEHNAEHRPTVDPVADMLFFDPVGALLFSSDRVAHFFSHTLNMRIWSGQPAYNPVVNTFENAGENYGLHYFFGDHRVGIFSYWGMSHLFGVTVRGGRQFDWSVGLGGAVDELHNRDRGNGTTSPFARIKLDAGAFIHRNGSLLASVQLSQAWSQPFRMTLYPGMFSVGSLSPGFYTGVRGNDVIVGLSFQRFPVGIAASSRR